MAKPKFSRFEHQELVEMFDEDEIPDGAHVAKLLGGAKILGEFDEYR